MSTDFTAIAHDVIAGVGLLQKGEPESMKAFGSAFKPPVNSMRSPRAIPSIAPGATTGATHISSGSAVTARSVINLSRGPYPAISTRQPSPRCACSATSRLRAISWSTSRWSRRRLPARSTRAWKSVSSATTRPVGTTSRTSATTSTTSLISSDALASVFRAVTSHEPFKSLLATSQDLLISARRSKRARCGSHFGRPSTGAEENVPRPLNTPCALRLGLRTFSQVEAMSAHNATAITTSRARLRPKLEAADYTAPN